MGEVTPQGPRIVGGLAAPASQIIPDFLHPLALPTDCLSASEWDCTSNNEMESSSSNGSGMEPGGVCPLPQIFRT